jgi:hypothetical protein
MKHERLFVDGFNYQRKKLFHPGEILVVDECMTAFERQRCHNGADSIKHVLLF